MPLSLPQAQLKLREGEVSGLQAEVASLHRVKEEMGREMTGLTIRTEQAGSGGYPTIVLQLCRLGQSLL